jgi:hypothetical protein
MERLQSLKKMHLSIKKVKNKAIGFAEALGILEKEKMQILFLTRFYGYRE